MKNVNPQYFTEQIILAEPDMLEAGRIVYYCRLFAVL